MSARLEDATGHNAVVCQRQAYPARALRHLGTHPDFRTYVNETGSEFAVAQNSQTRAFPAQTRALATRPSVLLEWQAICPAGHLTSLLIRPGRCPLADPCLLTYNRDLTRAFGHSTIGFPHQPAVHAVELLCHVTPPFLLFLFRCPTTASECEWTATCSASCRRPALRSTSST